MTRRDARDLIARDETLAVARAALEQGRPVAVWGPPGIGRSAVAAEIPRGRFRIGHALATLSFRPYLVLESAVRCRAPDGPPEEVLAWAVDGLGRDALVAEDLHLAHPTTLALLRQLAGRVPVVLTAATGAPGSAAVRQAYGSWGAVEPVEIRLGRLGDDDAGRVVRAVAPSLPDERVHAVVATAAGIPAWLVAGATGAQRHAGSVLDGLDVAARTALVAAALLARPAPADLLGPGAAALVDAGAATSDDEGDLVVVSAVATAALARVPVADRVRIHDRLADRLTDAGERARHLAAAGRNDDAALAAVEAAGAAADPTERAAHLHFAACVRPETDAVHDAVTALLAVGDLATASAWCDRLVPEDPADAVLAARLHRFAGRIDAAARSVRSGLESAAADSTAWRELLVESLWLGTAASLALPADQIVAACSGTVQEQAARLAADLLAALEVGDATALADLDTSVLDPPESLHTGLQVVRSLLRLGDAAAAVVAADRVTSLAQRVDAGSWATMAQIESLWCRYLLTGERDAIDDVAELVSGALGAGARDRAAALLELAMIDGDPLGRVDGPGTSADGSDVGSRRLHAAVSAEAALAVGDIAEASVAAAVVGVPDSDPVAALLAGPAVVSGAVMVGQPCDDDVRAYPPLLQEAEALQRRDREGMVDAAERWRRVAVRGVVRCLLASGSADDRVAAERLAIDAGLARWATRAGWQPGSGDGVLTARERQVMDLVAAGCTTPVIARRLGIAASTAESHVKSARLKLGATTRAGAVARLA